MQSGSLQFSCQHSSEEYVLSCDVSQDDKKLLSASVDKYAKVIKPCHFYYRQEGIQVLVTSEL